MNNNTSGLKVTVIQSTQVPTLDCRVITHTPLPDGRTRSSRTPTPTDDLSQLRSLLLEEKKQGHEAQMHLTVYTSADEKGEPDLGLSELLDTQRPVRERLEGETMAKYLKRWHLEVGEAAKHYGTDTLYLNFEGTLPIGKVDSTGEVIRGGGFEDRTQCTFFAIGDSVLAQVNQLHFAVPGVAEAQRQAIVARNEIYDIPTPPELEAWVREHDSSAKTPSAAAVLSLVTCVPNWPEDRLFHHALTQIPRGGAWLTNANDGKKYFPGERADVTYQPQEILSEDWWGKRQKETLKALDQRFAQIRSDMTADVVDVLFHHWSKTKQPSNSRTSVEYTAITLRMICEYRGISANKNNIELAYRALRDVRAFGLGGAGSAALFNIEEAPDQLRLWEQDQPPEASTIFVYAPGFFLAKAIEGEPFYIAPFMRRVWELNPYKEAHAKRLARYLRGEWRMNMAKYLRAANQAPTRFRTWNEVLTDAGIDLDSYEARKKPARFIADIHEAINTLTREGIIFEGRVTKREGDWIYHSEDLSLSENLPAKGLLSFWRNLRVCIDPPEEVKTTLRITQQSKLKWDAAHIQAEAKAIAKSKKSSKKAP